MAKQAVEMAGGGRFYASSNPSSVYALAEKFAGREARLSLRRARSTWLAAHLFAGTPLWALRLAAGPVSASTLSALLEAVAAADPDRGEQAAVQEALGP